MSSTDIYMFLFPGQTGNWVVANYNIDHKSKEMYPGVYHYQQQHYVYKERSAIIAGCSNNFNTVKPMQLEKMGFTLPESQKVSSCEVLNLYALDINRKNPIRIGLALKKLQKKILSENKLNFLFATCSEKLLPLYQRFGCVLLAKKTFIRKRLPKKTICLIKFQPDS